MSHKLFLVLAALTFALAGCNQSTSTHDGAAAAECTTFGATSYPDDAGVSTVRSRDNSAVTLLFDGLRAWTFAGHDDAEDDATLSLNVEPDGCLSSITVTIRGFCQAEDSSRAQPAIEIKWGGQDWTGTPECPADGAGYLMHTRLDASSKAEPTLTAKVSVAEGSKAQLTIDAIDLTLSGK